jgi:hypothetical protein
MSIRIATGPDVETLFEIRTDVRENDTTHAALAANPPAAGSSR